MTITTWYVTQAGHEPSVNEVLPADGGSQTENANRDANRLCLLRTPPEAVKVVM